MGQQSFQTSPQNMYNLSVLSSYNPVSVFNKIPYQQKTSKEQHSVSEMLQQMAKPGLPFQAGKRLP